MRKIFRCPRCDSRYFGSHPVDHDNLDGEWVYCCHDQQRRKCNWEGAKNECMVDINQPVKEALDRLSEEERLEVFCEYCTSCGSKNPTCQCWNDE